MSNATSQQTEPTSQTIETTKPQELVTAGYSFVELPKDFLSRVDEDIKDTFVATPEGFLILIDHSGKAWIHINLGSHIFISLMEAGFAEEGIFSEEFETTIKKCINPKYSISLSQFRETEWFDKQSDLLDSPEIEKLNEEANQRVTIYRRRIFVLTDTGIKGITYKEAQRILYKLGIIDLGIKEI